MATTAGATLELSALQRLGSWMVTLGRPDRRPLMVSWMKILADDNRRGILAGTDKDGRIMPRATYRPAIPGAHRRVPRATGRHGGFGPYAAGLHNNLTAAEYRRLAGPPLAPRGGQSRVITNLKTAYEPDAPNARLVYGFWADVVSIRGVPFLHAHFIGAATGRRRSVRLPIRDLRGLRPEGFRTAAVAGRNWLRDLLRRRS